MGVDYGDGGDFVSHDSFGDTWLDLPLSSLQDPVVPSSPQSTGIAAL